MKPRAAGTTLLLLATSTACGSSSLIGLTPTPADGGGGPSDASDSGLADVRPSLDGSLAPSANAIGQGPFAEHGCAVKRGSGGSVFCWGRNRGGELGDGTTLPAPDVPVQVKDVSDVVQVALGRGHSCGLRHDGTIACWGPDASGSGDPSPTPGFTARNVLGITDAVSISAGYAFACALRKTGEVMCWGEGERGVLGNGTGSMSNVPVSVSNLTDAVALSSGTNSSCAVRATGNIVCWGRGETGQLGNGQSAESASIPVTVSNLTDAKAISVGDGFACAVHATSEVSCWGDSAVGQLGLSTGGSPVPRRVPGVSDVAALAAGYDSVCVTSSSGSLSCWGGNSEGQLGNGTKADSPSPVAVINGIGVTAVGLTERGACMMNAAGLSCWGVKRGSGLAMPTPVAVPGF